MPKEICGTKNKEIVETDSKPVSTINGVVDKFKRNINYLRVSITDRCSLRCFYCMPEEGINQVHCKDILRYEELLRIIRIAVENGINKVRITGGEPLVRKGIVDFLRDVANIEGIRDLSLTTNGMLLEGMAQDIFDAGVKRINISIDSLKEETYKKITRYDGLKKVLAGLEKAYEVGFNPIKINSVVIRGLNDSEVVDFAKLTQKRPLHVRFIEYMPIGENSKWDKSYFISSEEIRGLINAYSQLELIEKADKSSPSTDYKLKEALGTIGFISPISKHFCILCNRLRLTADGKLRSCLFSDNEIDLKGAIRSGKSDTEISKIIYETILEKPEGHDKLTENGKNKRAMYRIGG